MGYLRRQASVRVELGTGEDGVMYWVELKPRLTASEMGRAKIELSGFTVRDGVTSAKPNTHRYQTELLALAIENWNLTNENDQPLPLHPHAARVASIGQLPNYDFETLVERVQELNRARTDEEEARFPGADPGGAEYEPGPATAEGYTDSAEAVPTGGLPLVEHWPPAG